MPKEKYGFVYIWRDKKHKRYYVGSHWGTENDGYICSSNWMRMSYKRRPYDFKRRIIKSNISSVEEKFEEEYKWLRLIKDEELGKRYYNLNNKQNHWTNTDSKKTIGEKISIANKGRLAWNKGTKGIVKAWNKGIPATEEHKTKLRKKKSPHKQPRLFHNLSDNHKDNIRNALKETLANKYPIENRYKPEFERGTQEWKDKISKTASQYMWITDGDVDKKVKNNTIIENGWRRGRKNKNNK